MSNERLAYLRHISDQDIIDIYVSAKKEAKERGLLHGIRRTEEYKKRIEKFHAPSEKRFNRGKVKPSILALRS